MKIKRLIKASLLLVAALLFVACASEDAVENNEKSEEKKEQPQSKAEIVATFGGQWSALTRATTPAKTRTTGTHVKGGPITVEWTATDRIWAKATDGTWHQSEPAQFASADHSKANFSFTSGNFGFNPEVRYVGNSADPNRVTIPKTQVQTAIGEFNHLGASGDCGTAIAKGGGGDYEFTLQHKLAYICFYSRIENEALRHNVRLVEIYLLDYMYTNSITGTFDFTDGTIKDKTAIVNSSMEVALNLNSAPIPSASRNDTCYYIAIHPNFAYFGVRFIFKDFTTNVVTSTEHPLWYCNFEEGKVYDYTAWLDKNIRNYPDNTKYYMWDARQHYWYGHLDAYGKPDGNDPQDNTDPRWYNDYFPGAGQRYDAQTDFFKTAPNANELCWYVQYGDPHWDPGTSRVVVRNGHLETANVAGLWLRKKSVIVAYLKNQGYPGSLTWNWMKEQYQESANASATPPVDVRVTPTQPSNTPASGAPSNRANYFFLPASGFYYSGTLYNLGSIGCYWSSSALPQYSGDTFFLGFSSGGVSVGYNSRDYGFGVQAFE